MTIPTSRIRRWNFLLLHTAPLILLAAPAFPQESAKPEDAIPLAVRAAALPASKIGTGLYDEESTRRTSSGQSLVPRERWEFIARLVAESGDKGKDLRGFTDRLTVGHRQVDPLAGPLSGSLFCEVPDDYKQLIYERIEAAEDCKHSIRVLTPGAAIVYLNGEKVWEQGNADLLTAPKSIDLSLKKGPNNLVIEVAATSGMSFLTTSAAQRVGTFLAPLFAYNREAFVWFEPWLEKPVLEPALDPLDGCLREVGRDVFAELRRRGGINEILLRRDEQMLSGGGSLMEKARTVMKLAAQRRALRLAELRAKAPQIAFAVHRDYRPSFFAYTEGLSDARAERHFHPGTSLEILDLGKTGEPVVRKLVDDPDGMIRDPDVSYDGKSILFAWKKSDRNDDFQLHEYDLATGRIKQLTYGLGIANYEGAYLPDNTIVFASTRNEHSVPCWITEVSNLYKMNRDGSFLRRLAIDQVHSIYPKPTDDGRIIYTRWDYSDRGQVFPHPAFQMNQDGTMQGELYGANSWFPTSKLHTRQIPGTQKFLSIAAGHHTPQAGKVVELDTEVGRDEGEGVRFVGPISKPTYERVDAAMQDGAQFAHPFPLDDHSFLAAHLPVAHTLRRFDLYWFDFDGGRELLTHRTGINSALYPVAVAPRKAHVRPERVDYTKDDSTIFIEDVYKGGGLEGVGRGEAARLRVVEVRYRSATVGSTGNNGPGGGAMNGTPVAVAQGSWDIKAIVGETPIHPDGSVMVKVPAMKSLYYQVLNKRGEVIQTMRTWDTNRQGEVKSCVGCHSYNSNEAPTPPATIPMAMKGPPATLEPYEPTGWNGFSFPRHVQPLLTKNCVSCHDGSDVARIDLRGDVFDADPVARRNWSRAYTQLTDARKRGDGDYSGNPDGPYIKWISKMSEPTPLKPYSAGSSQSPLIAMLRKGHHGVQLSEKDFSLLNTWIDLVVPYSGEFHEANAWSKDEVAFYDYYENKRRVSKLKEHDEIKRYLEGVQDGHWFAKDLPNLEVVLERRGVPVLSRKLAAANLENGAVVELPGPLREGDRLVVKGAQDIRVGLGSLEDAEIYAPSGEFAWNVEPGLTSVLPPELFKAVKIPLRFTPLRAEERGAYRNLARNPLAPSVATKNVFPNAVSASETRGDAMFRARNAIDGFEENTGGHSSFPHQAWGPEQIEKPAIAVNFGRKVRIDRVDLLLRADFPHDEAWRHGRVFADGREIRGFRLENTADAQTVKFDPIECETIEIRDLEWSRPGWCALTELRVWGLDADRTPTALIAAETEHRDLKNVPLQ